MVNPTYGDEFAWAAAWSNGSPRPFIIASTTRDTRSAVVEAIGESWRRGGETPQQGWKRAYRQGCRIIRVRLVHAFALAEGATHDC